MAVIKQFTKEKGLAEEGRFCAVDGECCSTQDKARDQEDDHRVEKGLRLILVMTDRVGSWGIGVG